jgi:bifunctional aspartokinase / homoserine dehydrogenase 1
MKVMKFGGSSVGSRLRQVLEIIADAGPDVEVVVSAMADTTDDLLALIAHAVAGRVAEAQGLHDHVIATSVAHATKVLGTAHAEWMHQRAREITANLNQIIGGIAALRECSAAIADRVLALGERISSELVAYAFSVRYAPNGVRAVVIDSGTWTLTDNTHGHAAVQWAETRKRVLALPRSVGEIRIHTGFLGRTADGRETTLGRNGSDYTATLLARALCADEITIWTDVPGVMTGDPALVQDAYPVPHLSYRETLELGGLGLRILHPRTMVPLLESNIPLRIRSTLEPAAAGTRIDAGGSEVTQRPSCVVSLEHMVLFDIEGTHRSEELRVAARANAALLEGRISVWFSSLAPRGNGAALLVHQRDAANADYLLKQAFAIDVADGDLVPVKRTDAVTLVTLVAESMGRTPNVAGRFFAALGGLGINVLAATQGATSRAISAVVSAADTPAAVRVVHAAMNLSREQLNVVLLGVGTVGSHVLRQIAAEAPRRSEQNDVDVRVFAVANRKHVVLRDDGLDPASAVNELERSTTTWNVDALLDELAQKSMPVLVDCTAAEDMVGVHRAALKRGIHVVAANKKPFAGPHADYTELRALARATHRGYRYETTVGASLPIIGTLANLLKTGDVVRLIEGSFSGTLGYLANEVMNGVALSAAVRRARELGYTEPHPKDDLSGLDAARKALILAREVGLPVEMNQVVVEPFVPQSILMHDTLDAFFAALTDFDRAFAARVDGLRAEAQVLRYLARIDLRQALPVITVGPVAVPANHPATRLRGTEAFVAFTTDRYSEYPLVIQGAGAGGAVTAAGVVADVLALSHSQRGH